MYIVLIDQAVFGSKQSGGKYNIRQQDIVRGLEPMEDAAVDKHAVSFGKLQLICSYKA